MEPMPRNGCRRSLGYTLAAVGAAMLFLGGGEVARYLVQYGVPRGPLDLGGWDLVKVILLLALPGVVAVYGLGLWIVGLVMIKLQQDGGD
jgi:hypothetical protein